MRNILNKTSSKIIIVVIVFVIIIAILIAGSILSPDPKDKDSSIQAETSMTESEPSELETTEEAQSEKTTEETQSEKATEPEKNSAEAISKITVLFNGSTIKTYSSKEDALNNPINLGSISDSRMIPVQSIIGYGQNVKRVRVWTENDKGASNGDEYILWTDNDWSDTMDLSKYDGTIIVAVSVADNGTPPHNTYEYIGVELPEVEASENESETETAEKNATEAENEVTKTSEAVDATTEAGEIVNPQIFMNTIAVTGYKTFEEAVANPVLVSTKKISISASNVAEEISQISVQLGDADGKAVSINCNPLIASDWSQTVNVEKYDGEIVVFNITSQIGFAAGSVNQFIAVKLQ